MSGDRKKDLIQYISTFIAGKHKVGTAEKILETIWDVAYLEGYDHGYEDSSKGLNAI